MTSIASSAVPSQELNLVTDWLRAFLVSGGKLLDQLKDQRQHGLLRLGSFSENDFNIQSIADDPIKTTKTTDLINQLVVKLPKGIFVIQDELLKEGEQEEKIEADVKDKLNDRGTERKLHSQTCYNKSLNRTKYYKRRPYKKKIIKEIKVYKCEKCDHITKDSHSNRRHQLYKHGKRQFLCDQCDKKFFTKTNLQSHVETFHENTTKDCEQCDFKGKTLQRLKFHIKKRHTVETILCTECPFKTSYNHVLVDHIEKKHTERKDWPKCSECNYTMWNKAAVSNHFRKVHKGLRIECKICQKIFTERGNMIAHMKQIHKDILIKQDISSELGSAQIEYAPFSKQYKLDAYQSNI